MTKKRFLEIINVMIKYGMLDKSRLRDTDYVIESVNLYLEAKNFVDTNFKGCF